MRRIASHYIYWKKWYRMHYLEIDADGRLTGIFPLEQEIANTEFYDGVLLPVPVGTDFPPAGIALPSAWLMLSEAVTELSEVNIYRLTGISPAASELGTNYSGCDCHVQRL